MIKIRGGREWRDLTALMYHHETQPMPNPLSRQAHLLPKWFHRGEVLGNHFAQLVVPFLLFVPGPVGSTAAVIVILTQLWLIVTGNFAWLNWITVVLAASAVTDSAWHWADPGDPRRPRHGCRDHAAVVGGRGARGIRPDARAELLADPQPALAAAAHERELQPVDARERVRRVRHRDEAAHRDRRRGHARRRSPTTTPSGASTAFKGKPGDVRAVPRQWAPYHLRLDWLMWFLPLGRMWEPWFEVFLLRLLEADAATLAPARARPVRRGAADVGARARPTTTGSRRARSSARRATAGCARYEGEVIGPAALR